METLLHDMPYVSSGDTVEAGHPHIESDGLGAAVT